MCVCVREREKEERRRRRRRRKKLESTERKCVLYREVNDPHISFLWEASSSAAKEELTRAMLLEFLKIAGINQRGEGLGGGGDCADDGRGELCSGVGGGRWKQQQ